MSQIIIGGQKYTVGGKTEWTYNHMMAIMNRKPEELFSFVKMRAGDRATDTQLVANIVAGADLQNLCTHTYGRLHDLIAREYVKTIDEWVQGNQLKAVAMEFREDSVAQPPNYTPAMTRLKNMSWRGYTPKFGGFCIKEPVVRILQLADYPIGVFRDITVDRVEVKMPRRPEVREGKAAVYKTPQELYTRILELRRDVSAWEDYYTAMCESIEMVCQKLERDLAS